MPTAPRTRSGQARRWLARATLITLALLCTTVSGAGPSRKRFDQTSLEPGAKSRSPAPSSDAAPKHDAVVAIVNERGVACSGVLIHPRVVLTAQHCRRGRQVVFGANSRQLLATRKVKRVVSAPSRAIDLALMILDQDAPTKPYALRRAAEQPRTVRVVGFGCETHDRCDAAGRRMYFDARVPADWGCSADRTATHGCSETTEMVLPRSIGVDTCVGDSGGAVLTREPTGWSVVAITSRGVEDSVLPCGDGGIYVRVAPQLGWILEELKKL